MLCYSTAVGGKNTLDIVGYTLGGGLIIIGLISNRAIEYGLIEL